MSLRERISDAARMAQAAAAELFQRLAGPRAQALTHFIRPDLGRSSLLGRALEPAVAASAMLALVVLLGVGSLCLTGAMAAAALIYVIVTQVFGIELDIEAPA